MLNQLSFKSRISSIVFKNFLLNLKPKTLAKFTKFGNSNYTPIFILGMPRSGTTLVEQILSNHPKVFGGDELNFLTNVVKKHLNEKSLGLFFKNIVNIDKT